MVMMLVNTSLYGFSRESSMIHPPLYYHVTPVHGIKVLNYLDSLGDNDTLSLKKAVDLESCHAGCFDKTITIH